MYTLHSLYSEKRKQCGCRLIGRITTNALFCECKTNKKARIDLMHILRYDELFRTCYCKLLQRCRVNTSMIIEVDLLKFTLQ